METNEIINLWRSTYNEYLRHNEVVDIDNAWIEKSNNLMEYWFKMNDPANDLSNYWKSFTSMLFSYINYYKLINENYRRGMPKVETKNTTGGRWLP